MNIGKWIPLPIIGTLIAALLWVFFLPIAALISTSDGSDDDPDPPFPDNGGMVPPTDPEPTLPASRRLDAGFIILYPA